MVGASGFEPPTSWSRTRQAEKSKALPVSHITSCTAQKSCPQLVHMVHILRLRVRLQRPTIWLQVTSWPDPISRSHLGQTMCDRIGSRPRLMNNSPKTQQLFFCSDLVRVFGVRFDKPWPTCYRRFHFLTKRTQVFAYAEVRQSSDQNSLAFLPYHAHTCRHFARSRPPTL